MQVPKSANLITSSPAPGVLLVLINRPKKLNSLSQQDSRDLDAVFQWFDNEPALRVAIISGVGRAFCAGADLNEWMKTAQTGHRLQLPPTGFGGISQRQGKKPIIAAVNGIAYGGGCEMAVNCDLVIACVSATFALPEVKRGVTALAGVLPRIVRTAGRQRATEFALTGRAVSAEEFEKWGICNEVVGEGRDVVGVAVEYAKAIAANSPDAVIVTREGLKLGWEALGVDEASRLFEARWSATLYEGPNLVEGLRAFAEKREPRWHSKL
ncbi:enoyl-CoA hydratase/isomerase family protein [Aspergillus puulaauensis]|uniref:Enoyl-CoA hydratase n=1 Tax=Aspergillus puulaauensis TaxID=1220207 RepID=A0A7R7XXU7_9EURO|nr:uncharacterized protein APUU_71094S [Aspergillus puulaauensis]BCS29524.1 hypothetical protein APUU_71094S [Aspergillus puulaauensis]